MTVFCFFHGLFVLVYADLSKECDFFSHFTRSTNMSNQVSRLRATAKILRNMSNHFFLQSSSHFLNASVSILLNKKFMIASRNLVSQPLLSYNTEVESSRTLLASRTHFQVLGLEASSPRKLPCPRLEDSTIFWTVEILLESARNLAKNLRRPFFVFLKWKSPEKNFLKIFYVWKKFLKTFFLRLLEKIFWKSSFFWRTLAPVSLVLGIGLERVCPWPWNFFVCLALASSFVSSTPPLL